MIVRDIETGKHYDVYYDDFGGMFSCGWSVKEINYKQKTESISRKSKSKRKKFNRLHRRKGRGKTL